MMLRKLFKGLRTKKESDMGIEGVETLHGGTGTEDQPDLEVPETPGVPPPLQPEGDDQEAAEGTEAEPVTEDDLEDAPTEEDGA